MVTDTMEKEEPIRLKLRTLGIEILSDITMSKTVFDISKIEQILSFLNIASDIRMISEMNCNILRKEFTELKQSIQEFTTQNHQWFEKFISENPLLDEEGAGVVILKSPPRPSDTPPQQGGENFLKDTVLELVSKREVLY